MRVDKCVCAVRAEELSVLACLSSRCSEVTEVGVLLTFLRISLTVFVQNYGDF
jgi:hypothetical protein